MRATRQVCLQPDDGDGVVVTVRELTVAEVRSALLTDEAIGDPLQSLVFDGFGLGDLLAQCDASAADLERFTPSELAPLVDACKDLNPFFFSGPRGARPERQRGAGRRRADELDRSCCILIQCHGHTNPWAYAYRTYEIAVALANEAAKK